VKQVNDNETNSSRISLTKSVTTKAKAAMVRAKQTITRTAAILDIFP